MKEFTLDEIKKIQEEQSYKYVALFDNKGKKIIPFNTNNQKAVDRLREIETRLLSQGIPDGYYCIHAKASLSPTAVPDEYLTYKGKSPSALSEDHEKGRFVPVAEKTDIPIVNKVSPDVLTYESALKLQVDLERLKLENLQLKKDILGLENLINEMEQEAETLSEEQKPGLMENAQNFLQSSMAFIAPLLDKHFDLKEKALGLRAVELQYKIGNQQMPPVAEPKHQQIPIEDFILTHQDQPEIYEKLTGLYNEAANVEDFLKNLQEFSQEHYIALSKFQVDGN